MSSSRRWRSSLHHHPHCLPVHSQCLPGRPISCLSVIPTLIPTWTNGGAYQRPLGLWKSWKAVYSRTLTDSGEPSGPHPVCATNIERLPLRQALLVAPIALESGCCCRRAILLSDDLHWLSP